MTRYLTKNHAGNIEIQSHSDCIRGDQNIVSRVGVVEEHRLLLARLGGQIAVNDAALLGSRGLDLSLHKLHARER